MAADAINMPDVPTPPQPTGQAIEPVRRERLGGLHKAAVLLISLGRDGASEVLKHLPEHDIEQLTMEMARLHQVPAATTHSVFDEVVDTLMAGDAWTEGGFDFAQEVLEKSLGSSRATEIMARLSAVIEMRPFEFLRRTPPERIAAFLRNESPQTVALTVANLHPALGAQVLGCLPADEQPDIAMRIARMGESRPEVIKEVESVMRAKLSSVISSEYSSSGGVDSLVGILNQSDRPTERNILESLGQADAELAEEIRMRLFVFEDIVKLDDRSVQLLLKEVDTKDLALALRGVPEEVNAKVVSNMSQRGAEMLQEEIQFMPPQPRRLVEEAQGRIVAVLRRLEEAGTLTIGRGSAEDEIV
jgi:flagellar motor switch protein FliG